MKRREWFKRWRDDDGYSGKHVVSIDPRVSGTPGFLKVLWSKGSRKEQHGDADKSIVKRAEPISHGLF